MPSAEGFMHARDHAASLTEQAATTGDSIGMSSLSASEGNESTLSISGEASGSTALARAKLKNWLTETRFNLSVGLLGLLAAVVFGAGTWAQSNLNQKSFDVALWTACIQYADNPQVQKSKHCQGLLNQDIDDFTKRDSGTEDEPLVWANISQDFDSWISFPKTPEWAPMPPKPLRLPTRPARRTSSAQQNSAATSTSQQHEVAEVLIQKLISTWVKDEAERDGYQPRGWRTEWGLSSPYCSVAYQSELRVVMTAREIESLFNRFVDVWVEARVRGREGD